MNFQFNCPKCRDKLLVLENRLHCNKCSHDYVCHDNYNIFVDHDFPGKIESKTIVKELITEIDNNGYESAVEKFVTLNPDFKSSLSNTEYDKNADIIFHGLGRNTCRCLDIKSGLGNRAEILSYIFNEVYAIEFDDDYIELQKKRFHGRKRNNISITKCDLLQLPFPDNFFDLILCNGVLDDITKFIKTYGQSEAQKQLILELKRVSNENGCIIFGVGNKYGVEIKTGLIKKDNKGLSRQGFSKYRSILENAGLVVKPYWVFPSYNMPYYSGSLNDEVALKGFFRNLSFFIAALRGGKNQGAGGELVLSLLKKLNYPFIKNLVQLFAPSFIFCCRKTTSSTSLEDWIKKDTKYQSLLRVSKHEKNLFILLNTKGEAEKAVYVKRYGYDFPNKIQFFERKFPNVKEPSQRIWMVDWIKGQPVNPQNKNEVLTTIDWLIEFQKKTKQEILSKEDAVVETTLIKRDLEYVPHGDLKQYYKWLDEYEEYIEKNLVHKTPVHGDFWFPNALFDSDTGKINMIDWETFCEKGNPYYDFLWFLANLMGMTSSNPLQKFKEHLDDRGDMSKMIQQIKNKINAHFGFKLNYTLLLRINLMKWMITSKREILEKNRKQKEEQASLFTKMLDILSEY